MVAFGGFSVIVTVITFLLVMSSHLTTLVKYPWGRSLMVFSECLYLYFCDNFYERTEERGRVGVKVKMMLILWGGLVGVVRGPSALVAAAC